MKRVRIGNDIVVTWAITKDGQPYSLDGLNKTLYIKNAFGKTEIKEYTTTENKIVWTFLGKDQKHTGKYSLELVINDGEEGMATTDVCDFVYLTPVTPCCAGDDDEAVETESIELDSSMAFAPNVIGGTGLQYAIERTVYPTRMEAFGEEYGGFEISDEERAYNRETAEMAINGQPVFISIDGLFLSLVFTSLGVEDGYRYAEFSFVTYSESFMSTMFSCVLIVDINGNAKVSLKEIQTGSSARDMNSDFSKDF